MNDPLKTIAEALVGRASVESVFGQPIVVGSKTYVPVARIQYGMGGGVNQGAGGGLEATPLGVLELTEQGARFLPIAQDTKELEESAPGIVPLGSGSWLLYHENRFALVHPPQPGAWLQRVTGPVDIIVGETPLFPQARRPRAPWSGHLGGEPLFLGKGVVFRGVLLGEPGGLRLPPGYRVHRHLP